MNEIVQMSYNIKYQVPFSSNNTKYKKKILFTYHDFLVFILFQKCKK